LRFAYAADGIITARKLSKLTLYEWVKGIHPGKTCSSEEVHTFFKSAGLAMKDLPAALDWFIKAIMVRDFFSKHKK